jgi:hypothetical protein
MPDARAGYTGARLAEWFHEDKLHRALRRMSEELGKVQTSATRAETPIDTGHLAASIRELPVIEYTEGVRHVYESGCETEVDYAPYVEHGTGLWGPKHAKYVIRPKNPGGWLRFVDNGKVVFAKQVVHQGSPGAHMFEKGASHTEQTFDFIVLGPAEVWAREQEENRSEVHYPGSRP